MTTPLKYNVSFLDGTNGSMISDASHNNQFGWATTNVGDINGDGLSDILIRSYTGQAYIIFGSRFLGKIFDIKTLNGNNGFSIVGMQTILPTNDDCQGFYIVC